MSQVFGDRLMSAIQRTDSVVCVGLDPRPAQLPPALRPKSANDWSGIAAAYEVFCTGIIDAVADHVGVVKPQAAFFEEIGPAGTQVLARVVQHAIQKGLLVLMDAKRGDIGTTAEAYARGYLGPQSAWGCDALTVNPYLGQDTLEPFVQQCDQTHSGLFVLVKTSNPGSGFLQDKTADSMKVYQHVATQVESLNATRRGELGYGPVGAVVGATYPEQLRELRAAMPSTPILIPGYGAQGGKASDVALGFDERGLGAIVNNSRNILFAYDRPEFRERFGPQNWQAAAEAATVQMNQELNAVRNR